jgi:hypothetical protein
MSNFMPIALLIVTPLLISVVIAGFFIRKKRLLIGYFVGLLPIYVPWQLFILSIPSREECAHSFCEYGPGAFIFTGFAILDVISYSALFVAIAAYFHRLGSQNKSVRGENGRCSFALLTIVVLIMISVLGGFFGSSLFDLRNKGVFVGWQNLGNPPEPGLTSRMEGEKNKKISSFDLWRVQVETNKGRIFETEYEFCLEERLLVHGNCWMYANETDRPSIGFMACGPTFLVRNPPGKVIDHAKGKYCDGGEIIQIEYAIVENGDVWVWRHQALRGPENRYFAIILGAILGLVIGSVLVFILSRFKENQPV